MHEILLITATTIVTGIIGAVSALWSYWKGRKVRFLGEQTTEVDAIGTLNGQITDLTKLNKELYDEILEYRKERINFETLRAELAGVNHTLTAELTSVNATMKRLKNENEELLRTNAKLLENQRILQEQLTKLTEKLKLAETAEGNE